MPHKKQGEKGTREGTIKKAKELLSKKYKDADDPPGEIARDLNLSRPYIVHMWPDIGGEPYGKRGARTGISNRSEEHSIKPMIEIPEFKPKAKDCVDRNGKPCKDVSEFFGITENGGECYKGVHYTIPEGESDSYRGSISDLFM